MTSRYPSTHTTLTQIAKPRVTWSAASCGPLTCPVGVVCRVLLLRQTFVLTDQSDLVVPTCVEAEISKIYDNVTKNRASAGAQINYNEFVAAVMWRRIQYDEEKVPIPSLFRSL